ncbi:MAG: serine/threonine protein phosphatase [Syntrophaceae bacterium]|nr:serine/threonine protein phosphatase [Syntrophaceae bacterium]
MTDQPFRKIYAIGDIHGCLGQLEQLIPMLPIQREEDLLLFIGDYIDRGPDSKGVVDYVLHLRETLCPTVCLIGNHEQMFLDYLTGVEKYTFLYNGGEETLLSYGLIDKKDTTIEDLPPRHADFFRNLEHYYETDDYVFVHAGLRPGVPLSRQSDYDMIWIRFDFIRSDYDFGKTIIFGHTPLSRSEPFQGVKKIGIDTGAVYGGRLTCLELPGKRIYQV